MVKSGSTLTDHQRLTNNTSFNTSTMYQRPTQLQMSDYEGENITSLHAKLHQEADKIRKWKVQTELEIKNKDKKLSSASTQIETMKKSLLELQLDNERLSSRMQEEIDERQEVMQKVSSTRELCNILKSTSTSLEDRMLRCETEKTELKYTGRETSEYLEDLSKKFENLQLSTESNHQKALSKYEAERKEKQEKEKLLISKCEENSILINELEADLKEKNETVTELQAALTEKNSALEKIKDTLGELVERNKTLEKDLKNKEEDFKESAIRILTLQDEKHEVMEKLQTTEAEVHRLQEAKDKMFQEMTESYAKYEKDLLSAEDSRTKLEKELEEEQEKLKTCQAELQETVKNLEKLKSCRDVLVSEKTELEVKFDLQSFEINNLKTDLDERKEEMHTIDGEMNILLKKLDRENLCKLQFQEAEKDLEAKICTLKLERDEQSQTISQLEEKLESKKNEVKCILAKESEQMESHQAEIRLKEKELEDERSQIAGLKEELNETKESAMRKDSELKSKNAEIGKLLVEIQEQKSMTEQCQTELRQTKDYFEEFKVTYEDARKKTDELSNQLKDMNLENKEHGKSLTSQQKKVAAFTKQNKELEKEVKALKSDLNLEIKKNKETEKALESAEKVVEELRETNKDLNESIHEYEVEITTLRDECKEDEKASEEAMRKAKEMQKIAKKETENAKALTESQLAEMMGTLDSYKQSSEKILADKDAEIRSLKNKMEALDAKISSQKDGLQGENNKLSSSIKVLGKEKEDLCKQLMETADENQSLKKKLQDLEKQLEETNHANKSPTSSLDSWKPQKPPVAPVTPQKQQTAPWTPKTPKTPRVPLHQASDNQTSIGLKTPQRSILRPSSSVTKRRKVAFLPDDNQDLPSSSDDLMEFEVGEGDKVHPDKYTSATPMSASHTPKLSAVMEPGHRMTPKRILTPLSKPLMMSTPKKAIPETPNVNTLTPVSDKPKDITTKLQNQQSNPRTPNIRNVPAKKTSKFFTTSPKDKAISRTRMKDKAKKEKDLKFSWFDLDSVYGFDPED